MPPRELTRSGRARALAAVLLAAGEGKRFKSATPKVLHRLCGRPLLAYVLDALAPIRPSRTVVVVGRGADEVKAAAKSLTRRRLTFALQPRQLGTADATRIGDDALGPFVGDVLVLPGDTPLLTAETIGRLVEHHRESGAAATVLTAVLDEPAGYGRIVRGTDGSVERIVEETDAGPRERAITEVNTSVWVFDRAALRAGLTKVDRTNAQREFYLTDVVAVLRDKGEPVEALVAADATEIVGINSRVELAGVAALMRRRINERLMLEGVTIVDPPTTFVDDGVTIGRDTVLHPLTHLHGATSIGDGCQIGPNVRLVDTTVGAWATILNAVADRAQVGPHAQVGPFAYLRPGTRLGRGAKVGSFVEVKKSLVGPGSKVPHLSYVGDATIGAGVNVGAGTITCNYDGERKHRTVIEDEAFIGSDTMLVAPVRVGRGAYTAAGSAITRDVPAGALAVERNEQRIVEGWATRPRGKPRAGGRKAVSRAGAHAGKPRAATQKGKAPAAGKKGKPKGMGGRT